MKRTSLIVSMVLALSAGGMNARAHGCYGAGFWPFFPLAIGLGLGLAAASSHSQSYPPYVYAGPIYAGPSYSYNPTPRVTSEPTSITANAAPTAEVWIPSTPGAGHWVPDPTPYKFSETHGGNTNYKAPSTNPVAQKVSITFTPGKVPVYVVTR